MAPRLLRFPQPSVVIGVYGTTGVEPTVATPVAMYGGGTFPVGGRGPNVKFVCAWVVQQNDASRAR
jgi:hypothetical protein